jgi:hypothetical protein
METILYVSIYVFSVVAGTPIRPKFAVAVVVGDGNKLFTRSIDGGREEHVQHYCETVHMPTDAWVSKPYDAQG